MAYQVRRRMTLVGKEVVPGDTLSSAMIGKINPGRLDSLVRVGHLMVIPEETIRARKRAAKAQTEPDDDMTPPEADLEVASDPDESADAQDAADNDDDEAE